VQDKSIVIVIALLNSLMRDQVLSFSERGLKAAYVNAKTIADNPNLPTKIYQGEYQLVYIGPEMLLQNSFYREMLLTDHYKHHLVGFAVDEAHCIKTWGDKFRQAFRQLGETRSLMSAKVHVMALTATATVETQRTIIHTLHMDKNICIIAQSPVKPNMKFVVGERKPKLSDSMDCLQPLLAELQQLRTKCPRTLIFCQRYKDCTSIYEFFKAKLGSDFCYPPSSPDLSIFRLVDMFIGITTDDVKQSIIDNFRKPSGQIRVLICTSSFGMGIDCKGVERVLHWGTPSDIEMYIQEAGCAGREGQQCYATLFVKPSEVKGQFEEFCRGIVCRRMVLESMFGVEHTDSLNGAYCCDICSHNIELGLAK
jgi:superfamily II DNA helicase RecQ